jgi:hypothetical protein
MRTPRAHQSTALPWPLFRMISGARYSGVPHSVHVLQKVRGRDSERGREGERGRDSEREGEGAKESGTRASRTVRLAGEERAPSQRPHSRGLMHGPT